MRAFRPPLSFLTLSTIALILMGFWSAPADPSPPKTTDGIDWVTIQEAFKNTAGNDKNDKYVFIHVTTDWCGWCRKMEAASYSKPEVYNYLNKNFYSVSFDAERKDDITLGDQTFSFVDEGRRGYHELAAQLVNGRMSYPTVVILTPDFQVIQPIPGYQGPEQLLQILKFFGDGHFKKGTSWEEYAGM